MLILVDSAQKAKQVSRSLQNWLQHKILAFLTPQVKLMKHKATHIILNYESGIILTIIHSSLNTSRTKMQNCPQICKERKPTAVDHHDKSDTPLAIDNGKGN